MHGSALSAARAAAPGPDLPCRAPRRADLLLPAAAMAALAVALVVVVKLAWLAGHAAALVEVRRADPTVHDEVWPLVAAAASLMLLAGASAAAWTLRHQRRQRCLDAVLRATACERDAARALAHSACERARRDGLTGIVNRAAFLEHLQHRLDMRSDEPAALLFIDVDDFKGVNDQHGHQVGDALLCAAAARLTAGIRGSDVAARWGGDEFVVLLDGASPAQARAIAAAMAQRLAAPYLLAEQRLQASASVGLALFPAHGRSPEALLRAADQAMYRAKAGGCHIAAPLH